MKAMVCRGTGRPGWVLRLETVPAPDLRATGVRVAIHAASVTFSNLLSVTGGPFPIGLLLEWVRKPKTLILGSDRAGQVEAVGSAVRRFRPGDAVIGYLADCGKGGYAEYVCAPERALGEKPANLTFDEAAAVPEAASSRCRLCGTMGRSSRGTKSWFTEPWGGLAPSPYRLRRRSGQR